MSTGAAIIVPSTEGLWLPTRWTMRKAPHVFDVELKTSPEGVISYRWEAWIEKGDGIFQVGEGEEPMLEDAQIAAEEEVVPDGA